MSAVEKPRYRVKARRLGVVIEMRPTADGEVLEALDEFRGHAERAGAKAIGLAAVAADGSVMTRSYRGRSYWPLIGAIDRLAYRMHRESE